MTIYLNHPTYQFRVDLESYPSGEWRWSEPNQDLKDFESMSIYTTTIEEVIQGLFVAESLIAEDVYKKRSIYIPFLPGARQDRIMEGEYADKLMTLTSVLHAIHDRQFNCLYTLDVHNPEAEALKYWATGYSRMSFVNRDMGYIQRIIKPLYEGQQSYEWDAIIAPDKGATDRAVLAAEALGVKKVIQVTKVRDPETGKLLSFDVGDVPQGNYLIVDDICDGGGTFIGIAEEIQRKSPVTNLHLFVTHGIFSQGVTQLGTKFNNIYTTNSTSKFDGNTLPSFVHVFDLF